jgi:hypothetical protein
MELQNIKYFVAAVQLENIDTAAAKANELLDLSQAIKTELMGREAFLP